MIRNDCFIFFGTGGLLSSTCLKALIQANYLPVLVVIQQSKSGYPNLTKIICENENLPFLLVDSVNTDSFKQKIAPYNASFAVVASFGEIFSASLLEMFPIYNVHMGVLPHYRGAYTNFWKILENDDVFGVTIHKMEEKVDTGKILLVKESNFSHIVFSGDFFKMNYEMAGNALIEALEKFDVSDSLIEKQNNAAGKYYRKFTQADMVLNPQEGVKLLYKKINRLQFYGNPILNDLKLTSAELLLEADLEIRSFELITISVNTTILKNQSGILLLKHHSVN